MAESALYLFDGSNLAHAAGARSREALVDDLASWLAVRGAEGIVVFDGAGDERKLGSLEIRYAPHADHVLERLAAIHRPTRAVTVVTSDRAIELATGQLVQHRSASAFLRDLASRDVAPGTRQPARIEDTLDPGVRARLEQLRRGI